MDGFNHFGSTPDWLFHQETGEKKCFQSQIREQVWRLRYHHLLPPWTFPGCRVEGPRELLPGCYSHNRGSSVTSQQERQATAEPTRNGGGGKWSKRADRLTRINIIRSVNASHTRAPRFFGFLRRSWFSHSVCFVRLKNEQWTSWNCYHLLFFCRRYSCSVVYGLWFCLYSTG